MNDIIEAISCEKEIIQLKLLNVPKHPKMIAKIFSILKDEEINVDMISQVTVDDFVQIEITLDQEFQLKLNQAIMKLKDEFKQIQIYQITTSKRTISLVIDKENLDQAIQLLKERFHIEEDK